MSARRPAPLKTASTLLRRHGDFAVYQVRDMIRQAEREGRDDTAWWHRVFDSIWALTASDHHDDQWVH